MGTVKMGSILFRFPRLASLVNNGDSSGDANEYAPPR